MKNLFDTLLNKKQKTVPFQYEQADIDIFVNPIPRKDSPHNKQLNSLLERLYQYNGYLTEITEGVGDRGADLIVHKNNIKTAIQVKRFDPLLKNRNISQDVLDKLMSAKHVYKADKLILLTTAYFVSHIKQEAKIRDIELIDREKLFTFLAKASPEFLTAIAYQYSIKDFPTCPYCNEGKLIVEHSSKNKKYYYRCLKCKKSPSLYEIEKLIKRRY
ncbi:restriction endonuclease [Listeria fleischmannii]|uniref:Endonuclease n=1 Tax=Listeria fleischmannii FSL S10-1203 TaxID=1265822 RepID=W7D8A3_9LIST|nr:restriction endonuclease [Listeria fleischmannii]EUJ48699.1 endonuclease [Listeria fleischmannii FSL S10-1203]